MRELIRHLTKYPLLFTEILIATFFIALNQGRWCCNEFE